MRTDARQATTDPDAGGASSLFEASLQDDPGRGAGAGTAPWRLQSQGYVAFFGGPLAGTAISIFNARRLRVDQDSQVKIAAVGVAAFLIAVVLAATVLEDAPGVWRLVFAVLGLVAYAVAARLQRPRDRHFSVRHGDEGYASLVGPGIAAVICARIVETVVLALAVPS